MSSIKDFFSFLFISFLLSFLLFLSYFHSFYFFLPFNPFIYFFLSFLFIPFFLSFLSFLSFFHSSLYFTHLSCFDVGIPLNRLHSFHVGSSLFAFQPQDHHHNKPHHTTTTATAVTAATLPPHHHRIRCHCRYTIAPLSLPPHCHRTTASTSVTRFTTRRYLSARPFATSIRPFAPRVPVRPPSRLRCSRRSFTPSSAL